MTPQLDFLTLLWDLLIAGLAVAQSITCELEFPWRNWSGNRTFHCLFKTLHWDFPTGGFYRQSDFTRPIVAEPPAFT